MTERDLEQELAQLAVAWPPTPPLVDAVRTRLSAPAPARSRRRRRLRLAAVASVLAIGGGTIGFSEAARSTVLEWLGLRSVRIERREPRTSGVGSGLALGRRVSLAQARAGVDHPLRTPAALGAPESVYLAEGAAGGPRVTFVYTTGDGRLLLQQLEATAGPLIEKSAGATTQVRRRTIDGAPAYFLAGAHGFAFLDPSGEAVFETQRLAGNTLLVERDGVLVRIEGRVSEAAAVRIARSLR